MANHWPRTQPVLRKVALATGAALLLGAVAPGCSRPAPQEPSTYDQRMEAELEDERRNFIADRREEIQELDQEIRRLNVRLDNEAEYASPDEVAGWERDLLESEQERQRLDAELTRAQNASIDEWRQIRGPLRTAFDALQARVGQIGYGIRTAVGGAPDEADQRQPVKGEDADDER